MSGSSSGVQTAASSSLIRVQPSAAAAPLPTLYSLLSLEHSIQYADALYGSASDLLDVIQRHFAEEKSFLGQGMLNRFCIALYGHPFKDVRDYHDMDLSYAMIGSSTPPSHLIKFLEHLVQFVVHEDGANKQVRKFIEGLKTLPEWKARPEDEFKQAWKIFWDAIFFSNGTPTADTFQRQINKMFPPLSARSRAPSFTTSLADLESVEISVLPTRNLEQHFLLEGNYLRVPKLNGGSVNKCSKYEENRVTKALGIQTLGKETLASLHALYGQDVLYRQAKKMELLDFEDTTQYTAVVQLLAHYHEYVAPAILAHRAEILRKAIAQRRSWWPTLVRDVRRQSKIQSIIFYGAILAVISVVCAVIQACASVWALALALKQKDA